MSGDKEIKYQITGDADGLAAAMSRAQSVLTSSTEAMKGQLEGVASAFKKVNAVILGLAAVAAGGGFFKEMIAQSRALTGESANLAKRLGTTGTEASALNTALKSIGSDSDTYIGAFDKFAKQLRTNEQGLEEMGLKTRDANSHLRDSNELFQDAIHLVGQYKPGLDQTEAAMALFGKGVDDVMKLQKLNNEVIEEAKKKNEALGLTVTQEGVAASKAYAQSVNGMKEVLEGVANAIGQAVMPIFTEFGKYLAEAGPTIVLVFKGALVGLLAVFRAIVGAAKVAVEAIFEFVNAARDNIESLGTMISKAAHGDWSGAVDAAKQIGLRTAQAYKRAFVDNVADAYKEAVDGSAGDMDRMFGKGTELDGGKGGKKTMPQSDGGKDKSQMEGFEQVLAKQKESFALLTQGQEMSKQGELAYWQWLLQHATMSAEDRQKIERKAAELQTAMMHKDFQDRQAIAAEDARGQEQHALAGVNLQKAAADSLLASGKINAAQRAQMEIQFENERHRIQEDALQKRIDLLKEDPTTNAVELARLHNEVLAEEDRFQQQRIELDKKATAAREADNKAMNNQLASGFQSVIQNFAKGTMTVRGLFVNLGKVILQTFASIFEKIAAEWLANQVMQIAGQRVTATAGIVAAAALAGAGGVASMAQAPYPLDLGAPAFGAAMSALAMSFAPAASASGGYDIPSGVNPVTQLHAREMVLPAKHADVVRSLADGAGSQDSQPVVNVNASPMPGGFFMVHQDELVKSIKDAMRSRRL